MTLVVLIARWLGKKLNGVILLPKSMNMFHFVFGPKFSNKRCVTCFPAKTGVQHSFCSLESVIATFTGFEKNDCTLSLAQARSAKVVSVERL